MEGLGDRGMKRNERKQLTGKEGLPGRETMISRRKGRRDDGARGRKGKMGKIRD